MLTTRLLIEAAPNNDVMLQICEAKAVRDSFIQEDVNGQIFWYLSLSQDCCAAGNGMTDDSHTLSTLM